MNYGEFVEKLTEIMDEKTKKMSTKDKMKVFATSQSLIDNLEKIQSNNKNNSSTGSPRNSIDISKYVDYIKNKKQADEPIEKSLFSIISELTIPPYIHPKTFFEKDFSSKVIVDRGNYGKETFSASYALRNFYPGGFTMRWGHRNPARIPCGRYFPDFEANLKNPFLEHELTPLPITEFRGKQVYGLEKIRVKDAKKVLSDHGGKYPACPICLSLKINVDEGCEHFDNHDVIWQPGTQNLSPQIVLTTYEDPSKRNYDSKISQKFSYPLSDILEEVNFLEEAEIITIATGFTRETRGVTVEVDYNPYLGYSTSTKAVLFKLKEIPDNFIKEIQKENFLVRDIIINIIHECILKVLKKLHRSIWENDLWSSGFIKSLELDSIGSYFDYQNTLTTITNTDFEQKLIDNIIEECGFFEKPPDNVTPDLIRNVLNEVRTNLTITDSEIIIKIKELLKRSLSYLVYTAGCLIAGSSQDEIGFVPPNNTSPNEMIVFDTTSGGNGASELIYNFLVAKKSAKSTTINPNKAVKATYFEEAFYELLLPCQQGIADRIFFQDYGSLFQNTFQKNNLIITNLERINEETDLAPTEFAYVSRAGIENMYPLSVGKRDSRDTHQKIQQIASICIHGCFDCLLLNESFGHIRSSEKFFVSKYLVDLYFKFLTNKLRIDSSSPLTDIETILKKEKMVLLVKKIDNANNTFQELFLKTDQLLGKKIDNKLVKLCGFWFDCPI